MRWSGSRRSWSSTNREGYLEGALAGESAIADDQLKRQSRGPFRMATR
jgi:hypothetical protein